LDVDQWCEFVAIAPPDEEGKAFGRQFLRNRGADKISRSDYGRCLISRRHDLLLTKRADS
jgi:hypothetical protein